MSTELTYSAGPYTFRLQGDLSTFAPSFASRQVQDGVQILTLRLTAPTPAVPKPLLLQWAHGLVDIQASWATAFGPDGHLRMDWSRPFVSQATSQAPVLCLYNTDGRNRLTFAASDALHAVEFQAGLHEETAEMYCSLRFFTQPMPPIDQYEVDVRIDTRDIPYQDVLRDVSDFWASLPVCTPSPVPEAARLPLYSTWYSMHQEVPADRVLQQCRLAKPLGCDVLIIDDGWETTDTSRGFGYTGDWKPERIPRMRELADQVHALGMKILLWYAVPYIGKFSKAWERFRDKTLFYQEHTKAATLDPRFPEVREYIIDTYEQAIRGWNLDGFKLDFIDSFTYMDESKPDLPGRDHAGVPEAVDRLMTDVMARLRAIKPDVMIEFRQSYIGPLMRKYGNMFRAGDCAADALTNRLRTVDIRLLCGNTAAHADPIMWNVGDPVEVAALQLLNPLFAVPQISMLLDALPPSHLAMLKFWLAFWRENRDVLLDGKLDPMHPHAHYPVVTAGNQAKMVIAVYEPQVVRPGRQQVPAELLLVNATRQDNIVFELAKPLGKRRVKVYDCQGNLVADETARFDEGLYMLPVPPSGLIRCVKV